MCVGVSIFLSEKEKLKYHLLPFVLYTFLSGRGKSRDKWSRVGKIKHALMFLELFLYLVMYYLKEASHEVPMSF